MSCIKTKIMLFGVLTILFFTGCKDFWHPEGSQKDVGGISSGTTYTVTFNANGGTGSVSSMTANSGSSITLPSGGGLSRSGYTFGGWNTNASGTGTNYNAGYSYTVSGNVTLYAKWNSSGGGSNIVITLESNAPYGWQKTYEPASLLNGARITQGDVYTFTYSFTSNVAIDKLVIIFVDNCAATGWSWTVISNYITVRENIAANAVINGSVTITATGTATNATREANRLVLQAGTGTTSSPTLTFTTLQLVKSGNGGNPPAPSVINLSPNQEYSNTLAAGETHQYRINVQTGKVYFISWDDYNTQFYGGGYADVQVGVKSEGDTTYVVPMTDNGNFFESNVIMFTPAISGNYIIEVRGYAPYSSGTYSIVYVSDVGF